MYAEFPTFDFDIELESALAEGYDIGMKVLQEKTKLEGDHFRVNLLDVNKLVDRNNLKPIDNPIIFQGGNVPTPNGLLSNQIFGITRYDRANTCAYIDLGEDFLSPHVYKVWSKLDKNIISIVHGTDNFKIDGEGRLVQDPDGDTGLRFLRKNFNKISITRSASMRRDVNATYIEKCQKDPKTMFISKIMVIPAFYRDVDTSKGGKVQVGQLNELYRNLIIACKSLRESSDYGLSLGESIRGRIQQIIVQIFDWFGSGTTVGGETTGANLPGKIGVIRRSVMSKTTDYANRLVLSAPDLKYDKMANAMVDMDHCAVPLAACISAFMPFVLFNLRNYFDNAFSGGKTLPIYDSSGNLLKTMDIKDYQIQFSEDRFKKEINRFIHGYSNRFIPLEVECIDENGKTVKYNMRIKGFSVSEEQWKTKTGLTEHPFCRTATWCDVLYLCAMEAVKDKHVLVCRYPIDSIYNQFTTLVNVNSTIRKTQVIIDGQYYPFYPLIELDDIGKNTANKFVDSLNLSNLYLSGIGGDYDGDTATLKGIYTIEANKELNKVMKEKYNFVNSGNKGVRQIGNETIFSLYSLTASIPSDDDKYTPSKDIVFA